MFAATFLTDTTLISEEKQLLGTIPFRARTLVGRDTLLAEIGQRIVGERMLTLTGFGGVGKTSIAQQLVAHSGAVAVFSAGVHWIDLAALANGAVVPQTVAAALGLTEQRDMSWTETLIAALQPAHALLVLDNCEHLRAECAEFCAHLLDTCPHIHILATSRQPLGLPAEMAMPIPPLDSAAASTLFGLCAQAQLASFAIDQRTAPAVATICTQLGGVPLAIELAAARIRLLSVTQIAQRMEHSLNLLAGHDAQRPPRQRSLRAALDWSYELLSADEQTLFCQLSVFTQNFDFDAVEAVCLGATPLDALAELVDKSLVVVTQRHETVRYHLHEVVRQYAAEHLNEGGAAWPTRTRHLAWAVGLAEHAELAFNTAHQDLWLERLTREHENIRSALETAQSAGDAESMLRLAGALSQFWNGVSISEGRAWLARGRVHAANQPSVVSAKAWNAESFLAYRQGDYDGMHAAATAALNESMAVEYAEGIAAARYRLGIYAEMKGAAQEARELYRQSLDLFRELGDRRGMSQVLNGLAHVAKLEDKPTEARHYYNQGLALARGDGDHLTIALLLISLANLTLHGGDLDGAEAAYSESLSHLGAVNHTSYLLYALNGLGEVARYRNDFVAATAHYREGLRMSRALGLRDMEAQFLGHLGHCATASGDYSEAAGCLSESLRLYLSLERTVRIAGLVHSCADLVLRLGYPAHATTLFIAGLRAVDAEDFSYLGSESAGAFAQASNAARIALAPAERAVATADGQALTLGEAAELALNVVYLPQRLHHAQPAPELQIFLFGQLRVLRNGHELTADDWVYSKTKSLLLFLLLVDSADKAAIGAALWPEASAEQLKQNFRMAIYHLRRALGRAEWITFSGGRYAFNRTLGSWVDVFAFEQAVEQASSNPAQRTKHLRAAAALYTGDLAWSELEGDLPLIRRERLHQQALEVLLALGGAHAVAGQHALAAAAYRRAIVLDSFGEAAHRGLMRSLARQGENGAALIHYQQFVKLLADELGVRPTPETTTFAAQIQAGATV